jgi:hypothetical protein
MTAIVLAAPERKRLLRELLSIPETQWRAWQRVRYGELVHREAVAAMRTGIEDDVAAEAESRQLRSALLLGKNPLDLPPISLSKNDLSPGRGTSERSRRRRRREAVTALDGRVAVTTGLVTDCIVCGKPIYRGVRRDAAYCSNACRQRAYRARAKEGR